MKAGDFTEQAEVYQRSRPHYPDALFDLLAQDAGIQCGDAVVEIGAGTGLFTGKLVERGYRLTALEPNAKMRQLAQPKDGVDWRTGTFDATGLPDACCAWVVAAQAFHWADPKTALPEAHRILKPGGSLTVLWNNRDADRSEILRRTNSAIARLVPDFDPKYRDKDWSAILIATNHFSTVTYRQVPHVVPMSADRYVDLWRSHNAFNVTAGAERSAQFIEELQHYLRQQAIDHVDVPYLCDVWTANRVD